MLAKVLCVVLLAGLAFTAADAQPPRPTPSPGALGTRAFTEKSVEAMQKAEADYKALNDQNSMDVDALDSAFGRWSRAVYKFEEAVWAERDTYSDVKAAMEEEAVTASAYKRVKSKAYDDEARARMVHDRAVMALSRARDAAQAKIEKAVGENVVRVIGTTEHHQMLQHKRVDEQKARIERQRKADAEKAKQSRNSSPVKSDCVPAGGLAGALNNVACKEQRGG